MMRIQYETELYHFGVPGMKWGVRKDPESYYTGKVNRLTRKNASYENKITATKARGTKLRAKGMKLESRSLRRRLLESQKHYDKRAVKQMYKGKRLQAKGARLEARSAKYERKIYKNKLKIEKYNKKIEEALRNLPMK